jgi:hypothetical protein
MEQDITGGEFVKSSLFILGQVIIIIMMIIMSSCYSKGRDINNTEVTQLEKSITFSVAEEYLRIGNYSEEQEWKIFFRDNTGKFNYLWTVDRFLNRNHNEKGKTRYSISVQIESVEIKSGIQFSRCKYTIYVGEGSSIGGGGIMDVESQVTEILKVNNRLEEMYVN